VLVGEIIRVALESIRANLFRAVLTMLGIIIGVGAVITMLAAGAGARQRIDEQIASLGSNILTINASRFLTRGIARDQQTLKIEDAYALRTDARYLDTAIPEIDGGRQLKFGNTNDYARVVGTTPDFFDVFNYELTAGRTFTQGEDDAKRRVAVLGADIPGDLETEIETLLGRDIAIGGQSFTVLGVLESTGSGSGGRSPDGRVYVPIQTAELRVFGEDEVGNISAKVSDGISLERAMVDIERVMRRQHRIMPGEPNDFAIVDQREFMETQQQAQQTFAALLASIAGVSLLVGGIGIMNIMLVSVTERTREIGIRMALGATRFTIMLQFLVESITLCLMGGLLGVGLGAAAANLLSRFAGWETFVSPESVAMASAFSVGVGLFFGILPARRAARLDPIEALRYE
jgi:putative ABC transport system permease protein